MKYLYIIIIVIVMAVVLGCYPTKVKHLTLPTSLYSMEMFIGPGSKMLNTAPQIIYIVQSLNSADVGEKIYLHVAGEGGEVSLAQLVISAIKNTKADLVVVVDGKVLSAHAYIALSAKKIIINPGSYFMVHTDNTYHMSKYMCGLPGVDRGLLYTDKCVKKIKTTDLLQEAMIKEHFKGSLSEEEIRQVLSGEDVYVSGDVMKVRLKDKLVTY